MQKIILTILILVIGSTSLAVCSDACVEPYDLTSGVSRFFSKVTGQNFIAEKVAGHLIKKEVKKEFQKGKIKASLKSYSVRDLKAGRFKSIKISAKDLIADGAYISSFDAQTVCDFNYLVPQDDDVLIKENVPILFETVISEDDLNKAMNSNQYKKILDDINYYSAGLFVIDSTSVKLKNEKMYYVIKYSSLFSNRSREIVLSSNLYINNGQIDLGNIVFENKLVSMDINKFSKMLNYINPLDFSFKILENKDAKLNIRSVKITNKQINIKGIVTLLKDKE